MKDLTAQTLKGFREGYRYIIHEGGSRSGKTHSILTSLHHITNSRPSISSVVSETFPHLRKGAIRDYKRILESQKCWDDDLWNKTDSIYQMKKDRLLEFFSADDSGKVHGPERDFLFINEAQNIEYEIARQLFVRTRKTIFIDFNPTREFWAHTDLKNDPKTLWIHSTYLDNYFLTPEQIAEIERNRGNKAWWSIYGEGKIAESEEQIYSGWQQIDGIPHEARLERYGLDFGYSCLRGDTLVATDCGDRRIDEIRKGDMVLTRAGYRKVLWSGSKGIKKVYNIDFGLDKHIIATGDHRIFTNSGWKEASNLSKRETICELKQNSKEEFTKEIPVLKNVQVNLRSLKEKVEVFDLTVEGEHEFFANGVLVHNCDPTVIVAIYYYNGGYIIDEVAYQKGLSNKSIADILNNQPKAMVIADSSEPKSIDEVSSYGVYIIGAVKGPGSVYQGIQYVQNQRISITKRSTKTIKAYRNYMFKKNKDGKILNEPDDTIHEWSNSMDAIRYGFNGEINSSKNGPFSEYLDKSHYQTSRDYQLGI